MSASVMKIHEILLIAAQVTPRTSAPCSPLLSHVCIGLSEYRTDNQIPTDVSLILILQFLLSCHVWPPPGATT